MSTIEGVRAVARDLGRTLHLNLFSEGPADMFAPPFAAANCTLHLDRGIRSKHSTTWSLPTSWCRPRTFSYLAGMISTGIVLHERYATNAVGEPFYSACARLDCARRLWCLQPGCVAAAATLSAKLDTSREERVVSLAVTRVIDRPVSIALRPASRRSPAGASTSPSAASACDSR